MERPTHRGTPIGFYRCPPQGKHPKAGPRTFEPSADAFRRYLPDLPETMTNPRPTWA